MCEGVVDEDVKLERSYFSSNLAHHCSSAPRYFSRSSGRRGRFAGENLAYTWWIRCSHSEVVRNTEMPSRSVGPSPAMSPLWASPGVTEVTCVIDTVGTGFQHGGGYSPLIALRRFSSTPAAASLVRASATMVLVGSWPRSSRPRRSSSRIRLAFALTSRRLVCVGTLTLAFFLGFVSTFTVLIPVFLLVWVLLSAWSGAVFDAVTLGSADEAPIRIRRDAVVPEEAANAPTACPLLPVAALLRPPGSRRRDLPGHPCRCLRLRRCRCTSRGSLCYCCFSLSLDGCCNSLLLLVAG